MKPEDAYQSWIEDRRSGRSDPQHADRVMEAVAKAAASGPSTKLARVSLWVDQSSLRRLAVCGGALVVGGMPLVLLAYVFQAFASIG